MSFTGILFSPETKVFHIQEMIQVHSNLPQNDFLLLYKDVNFMYISTEKGMLNAEGFRNVAKEFLKILGENSGTLNLFCVRHLSFNRGKRGFDYHVDPKNITSISI